MSPNLESANANPPELSEIPHAQFTALLAELSRAVAAGKTYEDGLRDLAQSTDDPMSATAKLLLERLSMGYTLRGALGPIRNKTIPWNTLIEAGLEGNCLNQTIEMGLADTIRLREWRRDTITTWIYPCLVFIVTYGAICFTFFNLTPGYISFYREQRIDLPLILQLFNDYWQVLVAIAISLPILALLIVVLYHRRLYRSKRSLFFPASITRTRSDAMATELAALMLEKQVAIPKVMQFVAQIRETEPLTSTNAQNSNSIERSQELDTPIDHFTTLFRTLSQTKEVDPRLTNTLRDLASTLREESENSVSRYRLLFPMLASMVAGLASGIAYLFLIYLPWLAILREIAKPFE